MMKSFRDLVSDCDQALKIGKVLEAVQMVERLSPSTIPRDQRLPLARICRRCGLSKLGLKLLTPIVYPQRGTNSPASPEELAEFAVLRMKIGSTGEALMILSKIDDTRVVEAPLLRAFCHMGRWEFHEAAEQLKTFLATNSETTMRLLAEVNLVACRIGLRQFDLALRTLDDLFRQAKSLGHLRLIANCHELKAQIFLQNNEMIECESELKKASEILASAPTVDRLYIQKWETVLEARKKQTVEPLIRFQQIAKQNQAWEVLRDLDLQQLMIRFDEALLQKLLRGTPYSSYRQKVLSSLHLGSNYSLPNPYVYGDRSNVRVDLRDARLVSGKLNPGRQVHRLLSILLKDFYRPLSASEIYFGLFPTEHYHALTSATRIHQALRRTRNWLHENQLQVRIEEVSGLFRLQVDESVGFILPDEDKEIEHNQVLLERLRLAVQSQKFFPSSIVSQITGLSGSSTSRFLGWAIENGSLGKVGIGRSTQYHFVESKDEATE